jgi:hypothetical protein
MVAVMARPSGSINKNRDFLMNRLQDMYGEDFHPIMKMAHNCVMLQDEVDKSPEPLSIKSALDGWDKLAAYTSPKLRAIEVTGEEGGPLTIENIARSIVQPND